MVEFEPDAYVPFILGKVENSHTRALQAEERLSPGIGKSSTLAVLFNGLGEDVQKHVGTEPNLGEARARARQLTVQLDES